MRRGTAAAERRAETLFWPVPGWPTHRQLFFAAVGVVSALTIAVVIFRLYVWEPPFAGEVDPDLVAVVPFALSGDCSTESDLSEGLGAWAGERLGVEAAPYPADPDAVIAAWRAAGGTPTASLPDSAAIDVARNAAAGNLIVGRCHGRDTERTLTATLWEVPTGTRIATATVTGSTESLESLVGELIRELLQGRGGAHGAPPP